MTSSRMLQAGDKVLVGTTIIEVDSDFAASLSPGDLVLGLGESGQLRRIPSAVVSLVDGSVQRATAAFQQLAQVSDQQIEKFFDTAASLLADDSVFHGIGVANAADVASAEQRGRSTTRLILDDKMRRGMVESLRMWRDFAPVSDGSISVQHEGWTVTEHRAPLGVVGFVFEGRPNVFADASGVLRGRNTVVFRIGSDALGTARALMGNVIEPAIAAAGLPHGCVELLDSPEHAAGWALFSDGRLALAVARGSGPAVSELGSIARQAGVPVSLHGTGGAWMIVGEKFDPERLSLVVEHSLDRKVCNTLNTVCVVRDSARDALELVVDSAQRAAANLGTKPVMHAVDDALAYLPAPQVIDVHRARGVVTEYDITQLDINDLSTEYEWERNPEFSVVVVDSVSDAVKLFNRFSPQFVVSCVSENPNDHQIVWSGCNAPFVGDGFTRWVDGQFALLRPELGLSNWQFGRLFARGGVLSGDSAYTVRLKVSQSDPSVHR